MPVAAAGAATASGSLSANLGTEPITAAGVAVSSGSLTVALAMPVMTRG